MRKKLEVYKRLFFGLLWCLFCLTVVKIHFPISGKNLTEEFLNLPFNSYDTANKMYTVLRSNDFVYGILLFAYLILYPAVLFLPFVYFLLKKDTDAFDVAFLSLILTSMTSMLFYSAFYVEPPREVYNISTFPFDDYIDFARNPRFVFPSLHVALPSAITLSIYSTKRYNKLLMMTLFSTILISISTMLLLMHWVYDVLFAFVIAYVSTNLALKYKNSFSRMYNLVNLKPRILKSLTILTSLINVLIILVRIFK